MEERAGYDETMGLADGNKSKYLGPLLRKRLIKRNEFDAGVNQGVVKAICKTFFLQLFHTAFFKLIADLIIFLEPLLLKWLIIHLVDTDRERSWQGFVIVILILLSSLGANIASKVHSDSASILGIRIRTALRANIYRKALTIRNSERKDSETEEIVSLIPEDSDSVRQLFPFLHASWTSVIQVLICLYLLHQEMGFSIYAGFVIAILAIVLNLVVLKRREVAEGKREKRKEKKIKHLKEVLSGMKVMKLYAWEMAFISIVSKLRHKELHYVRKITYYSAISCCIWFLSPILLSIFSFSFYVLFNDDYVLDPPKVFFSLSLFFILMNALNGWMKFFDRAAKAKGAIKRIDKFFSQDDLKRYVRRDDDMISIRVDDATLAWDEEEKCLSEFRTCGTMQVPQGSLIAVVGMKGSGKTSLLSAILGEMELIDGSVNISSSVRRIAYVPQQPWIQNETVKENILFGREYHDVHYRMIVKLCELEPDLNALAIGHETEVGSSGVKVSHGVKQRIAIARAVYSDADLFLFDDAFSDTDPLTARNLFDNLLSNKSGLLKGKTRIIATNITSILPEVDRIFVMKHGNIFESGTFKDLTMYTGAFTTYLKETSPKAEEAGPRHAFVRRSHSFRSRNSMVEQRISYFEEIAGKGFGRRGREAPDTPNAFMDRCDLLMKTLNRRDSHIHFSIEDYKQSRRASTWDRSKLSRFVTYIREIKLLNAVFALVFLYQLLEAGANVWLYKWSDDQLRAVIEHWTFANHVHEENEGRTLRNMRLMVYAVLGLASCLSMFMGSMILAEGMIGAAINVHKNLINRILKSPILFFERTPASRIADRFLTDMGVMDTHLYAPIVTIIAASLQILAAVVIIIVAVPLFAIFLIPLGIVFMIVERLHIATVEQLKRLDDATCSVLTTEFTETLKGAPAIRASAATERFIADSEQRIDENQALTLNTSDLNQWCSMRLDLIGNLTVFLTTLLVVSASEMDAGLAGLAVFYAMQVSRFLNAFVTAASEVESNAKSVDRVLEYPNHELEGNWQKDQNVKIPRKWPNNGAIDFVDYTGQDAILRSVTIQIQPREKIAVWGRTPAAKSAIKQALLRIVEPSCGCIVIDGMNISKIGLHVLRGRLAIISADPQLFPGTLRKNLDPFDKKSDDELWDCLELVHLKHFVKGLDEQLNHKITGKGVNQITDVKHRKLICLARAMLRRTRVLLVEEADALDPDSDLLIQTTIKQHFTDYTVILITNRIHAILDCKRVMLLEEGRIIEFDQPSRLLADRSSLFHALAADAGLV